MPHSPKCRRGHAAPFRIHVRKLCQSGLESVNAPRISPSLKPVASSVG